jgi:hypothetical protein
MITKENLTEVLDSITEEDINNVFNSNKDYVALQVYIFNAGDYVKLYSIDPSSNDSEEVQNNGGIVCDKDCFLQLFKDSSSINPFLIELI